MSDIRTTLPPTSPLLQPDANREAQQAEKTSTTRSVEAPRDVTVRAGADAPLFAEVEAALGTPPAPPTELNEERLSGAESFGASLAEMGPGLDDTDAILARFLKLAILSGTNDKVMQYLAGEGHSTLMLGALEQSRVGYDKAENLYAQAGNLHNQADSLEQQAQAKQAAAEKKAAENGEKAGIDPEAAALYGQSQQIRGQADELDSQAAEHENAALTGDGMRHANRAGSQAKKVEERLATDPAHFDRLMRAMAGREDETDRDEAIREMEEKRNDIASLVLAMVDANAEAKRALIGRPIS